ncbi:MAG: hypothetical protein LBI13_04060 [Streptococcaceae bacterium]|jgi:antitoxin (DNA-binding transcriptional repressor) of toxin-antitoxin stability system|nr:hypothetical protein [Streptococcaceae bacterium]
MDYKSDEITAQVAEVKENLSYYISQVSAGRTINIVKGKKKEFVAQLVAAPKPKNRKILWGALAEARSFEEHPVDFGWSDQELNQMFPEDKFGAL